jgi:hypothetical protein
MKQLKTVTPADAGVQRFYGCLDFLDTDFRRYGIGEMVIVLSVFVGMALVAV